jgi:dinuclear metal center YbgI/SA1388 family protein
MELDRMIRYLDDYLRISDFVDRSNNGLQIEGRSEVGRVGFAVDAGQEAFDKAAAAKVDLLIVHHGLFWGEPLMVTGYHKRRLHTVLQAGFSVYGAHLPLDAHPVVGNNIEMARLLGLHAVGTFDNHQGRDIGIVAAASLTEGAPLQLTELQRRMSHGLGVQAAIWPFREQVQSVGIITGSARGSLSNAIAAGLDGLMCGEMDHMSYNNAKDAGIGVVLGGHFMTETLGLKALARHLEKEQGLDTVWINAPTGL